MIQAWPKRIESTVYMINKIQKECYSFWKNTKQIPNKILEHHWNIRVFTDCLYAFDTLYIYSRYCIFPSIDQSLSKQSLTCQKRRMC